MRHSRLNVYNINRTRVLYAIIALLLLIAVYYTCIFWEHNTFAIYVQAFIKSLTNDEPIPSTAKLDLITTVESIVVVLFSVVISSIITALLVEKKNRNLIYSEAFFDIYDKSTVRINLPAKSEDPISLDIVQTLKESKVPTDMIITAIKKVAAQKKEYYYEKCDMDISCKIENGVLSKTIIKTVHLKSYGEQFTFSQRSDNGSYILAKYNGMLCEKPIEIKHVSINGAPKYSFSTDSCDVDDLLSKKQGYVKQYTAYYNGEILLNNTNSTKIEVEYITSAPIKDSSYIFRIPSACKYLHLKYRLINMPNYRLSGHAFGFFDDAKSSFNGTQNNELDFTFEDWIFPRDGICININKIE